MWGVALLTELARRLSKWPLAGRIPQGRVPQGRVPHGRPLDGGSTVICR